MYSKKNIGIVNRILTNAILQRSSVGSLSELSEQHVEDIAHVFSSMCKIGNAVLCKEWGLKQEWLNSDISNSHDATNHVHNVENPFGFRFARCGENDFAIGAHFHAGSEIIGLYDPSLAIENIANGLASSNINLVVENYVNKTWEKIVEAVMNADFATFGVEKDTVVDNQEIKMAMDAKDTKRAAVEDHISHGYNPQRLNKYDKDFSSSSVKDIMGAFGESLDEVLNRRDIKPEEKLVRDFIGVSPSEMTSGSKVYPSFYIPLAIMGVDAILEKNFDIIDTLNFDWSSKVQSVKYAMFEVGFNKEKRLMTGAYRFCKNKTDGSPMVVITEVRPTMGGSILKIDCTTNKNGVGVYESFLNDVKQWMNDNNYYRGQKIGADGRFLNVSKYNWDDIVLDPEVKDSVFGDVVGFLNHAELYRVNGLPFKRGLILYGKPGCGKTLLGKVVANQVASSFIWVTAAQASSAEFIKELFTLAREVAPTVLFFEDVDMYTVDRGYGAFNAKVGELLAQMDGMEENNGLVVVATTNRLDVIEKALAERPSRFDRRYCLDSMSLETTKLMVSKKLDNANLVDVSLDEIAAMVRGLNGCFIQEVVISAKRKAISRGNVDGNGVVNLDKDILQESASEVADAFKLQRNEQPFASIDSSGGGLDSINGESPCSWTKESDNVVMSLDNEAVTFATIKIPRNVNLTQPEKDEIDGEVNGALTAVARHSDEESAIDDYVSDKSLEDYAVSNAGVPFDSIDWKKLSKTALRKLFRVLVLRKNVSKVAGKGTDKLADKKLLGSLLHAMDMLSDRYYWVHAYARIATNFGLKAEIPFNPYKDQTSKDAALQIYAQITGKVQSSKKMEDKINKENNVFVPPVEDHGQPDFEFNQPKDKDNVTKPSQMK